jgi:hypothetical protein
MSLGTIPVDIAIKIIAPETTPAIHAFRINFRALFKSITFSYSIFYQV